MSTPSVYRDGTISGTAGSAALVGVGTAWSTTLKIASAIYAKVSLGGSPEEFEWKLAGVVEEVVSDTALTLYEACELDLSGAEYLAITWNSGAEIAEAIRTLMTEQISKGLNQSITGIPAAADYREHDFIRNRASGRIYMKDQGAIVDITQLIAAIAGPWEGVAVRFALALAGSPLVVDVDYDDGTLVDDVAYFVLTFDESFELQLPTNVAEGEQFEILFEAGGSGGGDTPSFAAGFSGIGANAIRTAEGDRTRLLFTVTAETAGTATAVTVAEVTFAANDLVSDDEFMFLSAADDNFEEPDKTGASSADWTRLVLPQGAPGATGGTGATGPTGPNVGLDYQWSTGTSGDPTLGYVRGNNADPALVTEIAIDELDRNGTNHDALLQVLDDSDSTIKATIFIFDTADRGNWRAYLLTAAFADQTGYWTGAVTYISHAGTIANDAIVSVVVARTGNKGAGAEGVSIVQYGALTGGDATDNRIAIQAAIDAQNAAGGGIVFVPPGEYQVTEDGVTTVAIQMKSNVWLRGAGKYVSTIKLADTQNDCHLLNMDGASGTPIENATISDLGLDGNDANNTGSAHCIRGEWLSNVVIENNYCVNASGYGIGLQAGTLLKVRVERNHIKDSGADGIDLKNVEDNNDDIVIVGNFVEGHGQDTGLSTQAGIDIRGPCIVRGNIVRVAGAAASPYGIRVRPGELLDASGFGGHYSIVEGNRVIDLGAGGTGIELNGIRCNASNNIVRGGAAGVVVNQKEVVVSSTIVQGCTGDGYTLNVSGLTTDGDATILNGCMAIGCGGDGFQIEGDNGLVIGCKAIDNTGFGFRVSAGATGNSLVEYSGSGNGSGLITDGGTSTRLFSTTEASWTLKNPSGEGLFKVQGDDGEGLLIRSGQTSDDVIDIVTERPVAQFLNSTSQLSFFIGTTTRFYAAGVELMRATGTQVQMQSGSSFFVHRAYTVATLPSAAQVGAEIYVSNETGGATLAFADGTNWRRHADRAIVA